MAGWISSKLKVAETLLQQIDQQAAESLGKNEKPRSDDLIFGTSAKAADTVPLKDQFKKKSAENNVKLQNDQNLNVIRSNNNHSRYRDKEVVESVNSRSKSSLTDGDWTELLSIPDKKASPAVNRSNGLPVIRGLKKNGGKKGVSGSGLSLSSLEEKRRQKGQNNVLKSSKKTDDLLGSTGIDGKSQSGRDSGDSSSMRSDSSIELRNDVRTLEGKESDLGANEHAHTNRASEETNIVIDNIQDGRQVDSKTDLVSVVPLLKHQDQELQVVPASRDEVTHLKMGVNNDHHRFRTPIGEADESSVGRRRLLSMKKSSSYVSGGESDSDTDSTSTSDSESEREREERMKRRQQILAERAAAKAVEAIKERENMVARLEGEKQSLEKILEERAKQQAQEASELQMTMMETMEAVELEKQKHNNTRMEALALLAKLETTNAYLARSLANAQWNLEVEVDRVAKLRRQIEMKEAMHEDMRGKISSAHETGNKLVASKGVEFECEILEAECSFITDKVDRLQEKARTLETSIEMTQKEMENPTEVEVELKRRLSQLTDHLILKQAQVEALSSEKATLLFRIEAVSRLLEENQTDFPSTASSSTDDIESGVLKLSNSKLRPLFRQKLHSGQQHLGSLVRQLDSIFCAGSVFLRRNSTARMWSLVYLACLHLWVLYILMSHSPVSEEARSGAVFSLENMNNTGGA